MRNYLIKFAFWFFIVYSSSFSTGCSFKKEKSKSGIEVNHIPVSLESIPKDFLSRLKYPYVRFYKTEVVNNSGRDLKIIWFDGFFKFNGSWSSSNVRNKVLRNSDFLDWYGKENMVNGVWLPPGQKAVCDVNWHWSETPKDIPTKWAFIAIDKYGNDYFAEKVVPDIKPVKFGNR